MFLQDLTNHEKKAFLTLAKEFIVVDGELSYEEERLVEQMKREMTQEDSYKEGEYTRQELFQMFESRRSRVSALIEMEALGYANMEYHTAEKAFIQEMAEAFDIGPELLNQIDDWVIRQMAMLYEAEDFWAEQETEA